MPKKQISSGDDSVKKVYRLQTLIHIRKFVFLPKYRYLSKIRYGKCQHADTYALYVPKYIGARSGGSSGSKYIIYQQNMFSDETFGMAEMKDAVHILPPLIRRLACLRLHHGSSIQRNTRNRSHTFGDTFTLIVSPHPLLAGM